MKKLTTTLLIAGTLVFSSCSSFRRTVTTETMGVIKTDIVTKPQIADLEIETRRVEGSAEVRVKEYYPNAREACISFALKDAAVKGKCDIVVQPQYEIEETKSYVRVKVTGFAGHYRGFRELKESDTTAFKTYEKISGVVKTSTASAGTTVKSNAPAQKKGGIGKILAAVLLIPIIILIASA